jgi:hypothetical protein
VNLAFDGLVGITYRNAKESKESRAKQKDESKGARIKAEAKRETRANVVKQKEVVLKEKTPTQ